MDTMPDLILEKHGKIIKDMIELKEILTELTYGLALKEIIVQCKDLSKPPKYVNVYKYPGLKARFRFLLLADGGLKLEVIKSDLSITSLPLVFIKSTNNKTPYLALANSFILEKVI